MDVIHKELGEAADFITPYIAFVNSHMVEFFTNQLWEKHVPSNLKDEFGLSFLKDKNIIDLFLEAPLYDECSLNTFLKKCNSFNPKFKNNVIVDIDTFFKNIDESKALFKHSFSCNTFMSLKKEHEVEIMSVVTDHLSKLTNSCHIVDIGDGKGYLSSCLALKHGLKVLGIDSCSSKTLGAAKRINKLKKQQPRFQKDQKSVLCSLGVKKKDESSTPQQIHDMMYKQVTYYICAKTDIRSILDENFPGEVHNFGIIGLHTCGNLSPACLNLFINHNQSKFLLNVGCCYHQLEEGQEDLSSFPLSEYLKKRHFKLGRNARMLALQAPDRIYTTKKICHSLMFRAILEAFVKHKAKDYVTLENKVGRIGSKCKTFNEYCLQGLSKLGLNISASTTEVEEFYQRYSFMEPLLHFYFMLRVSFAPVIENIILLDRLLYLHENGLKNSYLVKLFDPCLSPRYLGIISVRGN